MKVSHQACCQLVMELSRSLEPRFHSYFEPVLKEMAGVPDDKARSTQCYDLL